MNSRKGFSSTEWLILLALLLVGIAVIVPVYYSHAQKGKQQTSLNNLLQWGIALNLYLIENQNELPSVGSDAPSNDEPSAWYNALPLYISQPALTELQDSPRALTGLWINPAAPEKPLSHGAQYFFYYAMNRWLQPNLSKPALRIYDIEDPTSTVFMTETYNTRPYALPSDVDYRFGKKDSGEAIAHVLFCDGHVEPQMKQNLTNDPNAFDPRGSISKPTWVPYYNASQP
ncbi:MAG: hypothetical protein AAF558_11770 [Verrucomicrobiota bacterium]